MFCCLPDVPDGAAGLAEGLRVDNCSHIAIFAEVLAAELMTDAAVPITAVCLLLELVHQDIEGFRNVG
jgi:hypothetical protein